MVTQPDIWRWCLQFFDYISFFNIELYQFNWLVVDPACPEFAHYFNGVTSVVKGGKDLGSGNKVAGWIAVAHGFKRHVIRYLHRPVS